MAKSKKAASAAPQKLEVLHPKSNNEQKEIELLRSKGGVLYERP